ISCSMSSVIDTGTSTRRITVGFTSSSVILRRTISCGVVMGLLSSVTTTGGVSRFLRVSTAPNPSSASCRDRKVRLRPHHYSKDEGDERKRISAEALNNDITPRLPEQPVPFRIMPSSGDRREVPSRYQPSFYSHRCPGHSSAQRYRGQQFIALYKARNPQAVMVEAFVPA